MTLEPALKLIQRGSRVDQVTLPRTQVVAPLVVVSAPREVVAVHSLVNCRGHREHLRVLARCRPGVTSPSTRLLEGDAAPERRVDALPSERRSEKPDRRLSFLWGGVRRRRQPFTLI